MASELFRERLRGDERPRHRPGARHPGRQPLRPRRLEGGRALVDRRRARRQRSKRPPTAADGRRHVRRPASSDSPRSSEAHVEVVTADPERASVFVTEWRHLVAATAARAIAARRDAYEAPLPQAIDDGIADRRVPPDRPGHRRDVHPHRAQRHRDLVPTRTAASAADRIADHYADLALRALSEDHR